ncbi:hypothetical protein JKP88DRAFT_199787 [Tribonema minus]|uniref:Plastid lipid-associated protein/fibrillin conserved domain-containing protein n=1 Tax=Tribonema minus TaxID=303371 RepID=A0A835YUD2_9STRA|nr:hypothetical protein JKP88DRAFT_199787 [Tribonema minus]
MKILWTVACATTLWSPVQAFVTSRGPVGTGSGALHGSRQPARRGSAAASMVFNTKKTGATGVKQLKSELLSIAGATGRGVSMTEEQRTRIDELMEALTKVNKVKDAATSPLLNGKWVLQWTDEKETAFLLKSGLFGLKTGEVSQTIDTKQQVLSNAVLFGTGDDVASAQGTFQVGSTAIPETSGARVNFEFLSCSIRWKKFTVPLPPVGKGWFASVYLDESMRITTDSRGDRQIFTRG